MYLSAMQSLAIVSGPTTGAIPLRLPLHSFEVSQEEIFMQASIKLHFSLNICTLDGFCTTAKKKIVEMTFKMPSFARRKKWKIKNQRNE